MGSYEEEYRKYYSNTKAKLNIKSDNKSSINESDLEKEGILDLNSAKDIYPKTNYNNGESNIYSKEENKSKYLVEGCQEREACKGTGTYRGINNYNNSNSYKGGDGYNGKNYYGYNGGHDLNGKVEEKNLLGKWGNRIIFELVLTVVLFICVIGMKSLPYKEAKTVYTSCKEIVNKDFDYKEFIEEVKTINFMEEIDKIKVSLKIDEAIKTKSEDVIDSKLDDETTSDEVN
ncbi:hypothetical protein KPL39_10190 [Clostridium gasigenes]|uniref:hypothetical protein n=1 Tax=Clostridium gasigenes TaxID=94869 RepID=UPI001C0B5236|nr:hypothetical protein [Clostridium gasigenes]MBU3136634.1 hypothetical protein [Clostridium gasigenes]